MFALEARNRVARLPEGARFPPPSAIGEMTRAAVYGRNGQAEQSLVAVRKVRETLPWQKNACQLEINLHRLRKDAISAQAVLDECLGYFPTKYLR